MFGWLKELLDIVNDNRERKLTIKTETGICDSCETLKMQLSIANQEKKDLLDRLLNPPKTEEKQIDLKNLKPVLPHHVPFSVRREMLQAEDRAAAKARRSNEKNLGLVADNKDTAEISTEDLEKEMNIAAAERENQTGAANV